MVKPSQELMLVSADGIVLRTPVEHISLIGRSTLGVRVMDMGEGDAVAAISVIEMEEVKEPIVLPAGATRRARRGATDAKADGKSEKRPTRTGAGARGATAKAATAPKTNAPKGPTRSAEKGPKSQQKSSGTAQRPKK